MEQRFSDNETSKRDIPSFIEPRPPLINNPFMRPRPEKGRNLLELFEEDSEFEEPELVQVYLRVKPCQAPNNLYELRSDKCLVTSLDTATATHGRRTQHNVSRMYKFSHIFNAKCSQKVSKHMYRTVTCNNTALRPHLAKISASAETSYYTLVDHAINEIFDRVVKENLKKLPDGHSFTLLAYGASGSGKTYTLMGTVNSPGLIPRSLEYVFKLVYASHQPIYKPTDGESEKLDCYQQEFELQGVTQAFVRTSVEAYDVMVAGKHNLVVAETGIHAQSSRSHCIFTITMLSETGECSC
ncbi:Kinesin-like protein 6 [Operophtera brumata]|uniref:Kinesin-like protein 6 n=1 Tax=Operophtera brumata TaxID=104452 RepID=A0A0L7L713_OPEBR|nr:Kinesin-like protein 6 [Operophtera brumata]